MKANSIIYILILILLLAVVSFLAATERTLPSRISYSFYHSEYQDYSDSTSNIYQYEDDTSLLLHSRFCRWDMHSSTTNAWSITPYYYHNTLQNIGNNTMIDYTSYYLFQSAPGVIDTMNVERISFILDDLGRTIYYNKEIWIDTTNSFAFSFRQYRHYNAEGYVDSMFVEGQSQKYFKRTFSNGMLRSTTVYSLSNGITTPEHRYIYIYADPPVHFPASIRFDNYTTQIGEYVFDWESIYNPKYLTNSIMQQDWSNNIWVVNTNFPYELSYNQNYGVTMTKEIGSRLDCFVANLLGDIIVKSSNYTGLTKHTSYTWDYITLNEENITQPIETAVIVYPNPFYDHLKISFKSKVNAPADVSIYNIKGQLVHQWSQQTTKQLSWDGRDRDNQVVAAGVYFLRFQQNNETTICKFIKLK